MSGDTGKKDEGFREYCILEALGATTHHKYLICQFRAYAHGDPERKPVIISKIYDPDRCLHTYTMHCAVSMDFLYAILLAFLGQHDRLTGFSGSGDGVMP